MSSPGQILGGIAGAVIGFFVPAVGPILGAQLGMMAGGAIDPPKGPTVQGPRLKDLSVTGVGFDQPLPRLYGTITTFGTLIWVENNELKETKHTEEQGGKGGGGQEAETFTYSYTFALALGMGEIHGIRRIWCSGKLLYDAGSDDIATIIASNELASGAGFKGTWDAVAGGLSGGMGSFRLYRGTDDQLPDSRIQADLGIDNTPAWRGMSYIVWDDFQLEDYGNSPMGAQLKVEVVAVGDTAGIVRKFETTSTEWRFAQEEAVVGGDQMFEGVPHIVSLTDGILDVRQLPTFYSGGGNAYLLSATDGHLIRRTAAANYIGGDATGETPGNPCGILPWGDHLYVDPSVTIAGGGLFTYPGLLVRDSEMVWEDVVYLTVDGYEDRTVLGSALSNDGSQLFLIITKSGQSVGGSPTRDWLLLSTSPLEVVANGTTEDGFSSGSVGWTRSAITSFRANSFDAASGLLCVVEGAGSGRISVYSVVSGVLEEITYAETSGGVTYAEQTYPSVYFDSGIAYVISGTDYNVFSFGKITPEQITLRSIVESECLASGLLESADIDATALTSLVRGYRVANAGPLRAAIEPLQAAWPFDVVPRGHQIVFVPRGQSPVATVAAEELGAVAGNDQPGVAITVSREMDIQIPRRVEVSYLEIDREYDVGNQAAERLNTDAVNVFKTELSIAFNATEAIQRAEVLLYLYWLERNDLSFVLPPTFGNLEASDVITINATGATYEARLTSTNLLPDGRLECTAKLNNAAVYTSTAVADGGYSPPQTLPLAGGAETVLMDLPCVDARTDACGFLAASSGYLDAWGGGGLFYSADSGESWRQLEWIMPPGAVMGLVPAAVGVGRTDIFDGQNALTVRLFRGELFSVSEAALMAGANHFAYGQPGRWEIVAAQNVTENADNTFTLTRLIRGRFGTEDQMAEHESNDYLVRLDALTNYWIGMELSSINAARKFRLVNRGSTLESASDIDFTLVNESRICRKPAGLRGALLRGSYEWTITGTPRSRLPVPTFSGIAQPSGESSALYRLKIYNNDFSILKRTLESSDATFSYTSAHQGTDFGGVQETLYTDFVQVSPTMGEGHALRTSLSATGIYNPMFSLLHFGNNGASIIDSCGNTWTNAGYAFNNSSGYVKWGSYGYIADTNYHYTDFSSGPIAAGDFAFDWWDCVRYENQDQGMFHLNAGGIGADNLTGIGCYRTSGNRMMVIANGTATDVGPIGTAYTWEHCAIERKNGVIRFYRGGVASATTISDTSNYSTCTQLVFGGARSSTYLKNNAHALDEFRAMGSAAYNGTNFTPPTGEYANP